ncbi:unnamed protein product [Phyllotreta striolata]|uniref:asparaginase n=1 Tax=Phyllotreta striolata TaxID=444603 RepID=A0A9P0GUW0_PHYSR|nr:unnamed protein product [Phyllotreta striolata]
MNELKRVLVLYAGGTIGMQKNFNGVLCPKPNAFLNEIKHHPDLHDPNWTIEELGKKLEFNELVLPKNYGHQKIIYEIIEYTPLLDSSNMSCKDWIRLASDIEYHYNNYDGFVILHGTDTLGYTSSALSFMLDGLQKPVIVTGSQIPIFESRSDARDNFAASLVIAGLFDIPEVCVFFANKLFRGNRVAKISTNSLDAFDTPNYHPLVEVGIGFSINEHYIRKVDYNKPFKVYTDLNPNVAVLSFFPTITSEMVESFLRLPLEGVVIQSFGTGNVPSKPRGLLEVLKQAVLRNTLIVNITQCSKGTVISSSYETGKVLDEIGVVSGEDMTVEAALTKLTYVLGLPGLSFSQRIAVILNISFTYLLFLPNCIHIRFNLIS